MSLGSFLVAMAGPVLKKALTSIGVGIVSYVAISTALNAALDAARNAWGGFAGDSLTLVTMSGIPTAMSIITGALVARVGLMQLKKFEVLK